MDNGRERKLISKLLNNGSKEINGYHLERLIGSGAFGEVYLAKKGNRTFAAKAYNHSKIGRLTESNLVMQFIKEEINILKNMFDHPNIIKVHESFESENHIYMITDYYEEGDVMKRLAKGQLFTEAEALRLLTDITEAMFYANNKKVIHRDIKPENILVRGDGFVLADFGVAKICERFTFTHVGTRPYMSPQILLSETYTSKCDVWSLGITVWLCLFQKDPWNTHAITEGRIRKTEINVTNHKKTYGSELVFPEKPQISKPLMKIICSMLEKSENDRISWAELRNQLMQLKGRALSSFPKFNSDLELSIEPIVVQAVRKENLIQGQIRWIFEDTQVMVQTATESGNDHDFDLEITEDIEIIQRFLDLNSRLCNLFLMAIDMLQVLAEDSTFADISHWIETVRAFVCIKVNNVSKYCFERLKNNKPFTQFLTNMFHQNGFATQYQTEFYELACNSSMLRKEAAKKAGDKLSEKQNSDPKLKENTSLTKYIEDLKTIMSNQVFHKNYQEFFRSVMCKTIAAYSKNEKSYAGSIGNFKQAFVLVHLAENYSESMVETAKKKQSDGFENIYSLSESDDMIEDIFAFAVKHYSSQK